MNVTSTETATAQPGAPRIIKPVPHHYGVNSARREELLAWYAEVVGFEVTSAGDSPIPSAFVTNDRAHHRSGFFTPPGLNPEAPRPHVGVNHVGFEYESVDDLLESWARLSDAGIEPLIMCCHGTHYAFYYRDPEGSIVELLADAWGDWDKSLAYQRTEIYALNPMGCFVDPDRLIAARKQGMGIDELRERTMNDEFVPETHNGPEVLM